MSPPSRRLPWFLLDLLEGPRGLNKYPTDVGITLNVAVLYLETNWLNKLVFANVQNCFAF